MTVAAPKFGKGASAPGLEDLALMMGQRRRASLLPAVIDTVGSAFRLLHEVLHMEMATMPIHVRHVTGTVARN